MFRELYKSANEEIKGDRAILEKAFMKAQQPEKKPMPVFKYSFVGTAVAAVIIVGALFANSDLFTDKINDLPKQNALENATEAPDVIFDNANTTTEDTAGNFVAATEEKKTAKSTKEYENKTYESGKSDAKPENAAESAAAYLYAEEDDAAVPNELDLGISVMSINDEAYEADDTVDTTAVWGLRKAFEEESYAETDDLSDEFSTDGIAAPMTASGSGGGAYIDTENREEKMFSYMYDLTVYGEKAKTESFVNTAASPVTNESEAVKRAESECTIEYDNTEAYYDKAENMWKVVFTGETEQIVYMNTDGITTLVVYIK